MADEQNPKVSRERLNQIASRKLAQLGVTTRPAADPQWMEGELPLTPGRVLNPITGQALTRARFLVWGHDCLRFMEAPLSCLKPVQFYDLNDIPPIELRVLAALAKRGVAVKELDARLISLKLKTVVDPEQLVVRAYVETLSDTFELLADPEGEVRVMTVTTPRGKPQAVSPDFPPLQLSDYQTGLDLELYLSSERPKMFLPSDPSKAKRASDALEVVAPSAPAVTLQQLAMHLGAEAQIVPGPKLEVTQDLRYRSMPYRFSAVQEQGTTFKGKLTGPTGDKWADRFDLLRFPGVMQLASAVLGITPAQGAAPAAPTAQATTVTATPTLTGPMAPRAGAVWIMNVLVEQDDGKEIRYACTDVDGRPYGATRLLAKADFQGVFVQQQGMAWRLYLLIEQIVGDQIIYRQMNAQRQPVGDQKKMIVGILVSNFVPEPPMS